MDILDLKPSITQLPSDEVMELIKSIRLSRRQSKMPAKREAKAQTKNGKVTSKKISGMTPELAAKMLKMLEEMIK